MSKPGLSGLVPGCFCCYGDAGLLDYYAGIHLWGSGSKEKWDAWIKEQQFPYCWGTVGSAFFFHHLYVWNGAPWGCAEPKPGSVKLLIWDDPPYPRDP